MIKNVLAFLFVLVAHLGNSQVTLTITDPDYSQTNPLNCAGIVPTGGTNFIDGVGNYLPNTDQTLVLCPDLTQGSKVSISFAKTFETAFSLISFTFSGTDCIAFSIERALFISL